MKKIILSVILLCGLSGLFNQVSAQMYITPRSLSFAQAYATQSRGANALGWNPANLGYADNPGFGMKFGIFPFVPFPAFALGNNSLSASWYNTYLTKGGFLTEQTKNEMLSVFPSDGWNIHPRMHARLIGLSFGHTAMSFDLNVAGSINMPKSLLRTMFYGIEFEQPVSLDDLNGEIQAVGAFSVAHGRPINLPYLNQFVERSYLGVGVKFLAGGAYFNTKKTSGSITTFHDHLRAQGEVLARYSYLGYGYALDLGLGSDVTDKLHANIGVNNLFGTINWSGSRSKFIHYVIDFNSDTLDLANVNGDTLANNAVKKDSSYASPGFSSPYPGYLILGVQYDLLSNLDLYLNYKQGFSDRFGSSTIPQISIATEYRPLRWFPLRLGLTTGGLEKFQWGGGFGFEFTHYTFTLGVSQYGGFFNHANGFAVSMGQELLF